MKPSFLLLASNVSDPIFLPGLTIDGGETLLSYDRYIGDETLRSAVNSLVSRNAMQVITLLEANHDTQFNNGAFTLTDWFPILTEAELDLELERKPLVPELGRALILAVEPDDADLAPGQGAIFITNDPTLGFGIRVKAKGAYAQLAPEGQSLIYTAKKIGFPGNLISVEHIKGTPGAGGGVVVDVEEVDNEDGNLFEVVVTLPTTGDAVPAVATLNPSVSGPGLNFTSRTPGAAPNGNVQIYYAQLVDDEVDDTTVEVDDGVIAVTVSQTAAVEQVQASIVSVSEADNSEILFTADEGNEPGAEGNGAHVLIVASDDIEDVLVEFVNGGGFGSGFMYKITLPSVDGVPFANANNVVTAINAFNETSNAGHNFMQASSLTGDGGIVDVWDDGSGPSGSHPLTGGVDGADAQSTATGSDIIAAIEADDDANALVSAALNGPDGVVDYGHTSSIGVDLEDGVDADSITAGPSDVTSAVNATAAAAALVTADYGNGDGAVAELEQTSLAGGDDSSINFVQITTSDIDD